MKFILIIILQSYGNGPVYHTMSMQEFGSYESCAAAKIHVDQNTRYSNSKCVPYDKIKTEIKRPTFNY
jgi:hypothetical protein